MWSNVVVSQDNGRQTLLAWLDHKVARQLGAALDQAAVEVRRRASLLQELEDNGDPAALHHLQGLDPPTDQRCQVVEEFLPIGGGKGAAEGVAHVRLLPLNANQDEGARSDERETEERGHVDRLCGSVVSG